MRAVGLVVIVAALTACSSAPPEGADPLRPASDTGVDTARDTLADTEPDTGSDTSAPEDAADTALAEVETGAGEDTSTDTAADTASDTSDAAVDTAPPDTATWSTTFPNKPPAEPFDHSPEWFVQRARLAKDAVVVGTRTLPAGPRWSAWSATLKIDRHMLTCPEVEVVIGVLWNCVGSFCDGSDATVKIPRSTSSPTWTTTVGGPIDAAITTDPPRVQIRLSNVGGPSGVACGPIDVWPSPITFSGTP